MIALPIIGIAGTASASEPDRVDVSVGGLSTAVNVLAARHQAVVHLELPPPDRERDRWLVETPGGPRVFSDRVQELRFAYPAGDVRAGLEAAVKAWNDTGGWGRPQVQPVTGGYRVVPTVGPDGLPYASPLDCRVRLEAADAPTRVLVQYLLTEVDRQCGVTFAWFGHDVRPPVLSDSAAHLDDEGRWAEPVPNWVPVHVDPWNGTARVWLERLLVQVGGSPYRLSWLGGVPVLGFHHASPRDEFLANRTPLTGPTEWLTEKPVRVDPSLYDPATDPFRRDQLPLVRTVNWEGYAPAGCPPEESHL